MARINFKDPRTATYRSMSIHQKINVRSGFDVATACESGKHCRYAISIRVQSLGIGHRVYSIDDFYISPRKKQNRYGCTE